jgi:3-deoxy-D-manno-octulosonate 8-phosphate phosphatase (KDO 8-P phosphatase)
MNESQSKACGLKASSELSRRIRRIRLIAFDFDGVFTDNKVYLTQDGIEMVCCWRSDGLGLQALARLSIDTAIISTEKNPVVGTRAKKLGVSCWQGCDNKLEVLERLAAEKGVSLDQVAFVGNDINDLECLSKVGLPIVVNDSHADLSSYGYYRTNAFGGRGAVREICDLIVAVLKDSKER